MCSVEPEPSLAERMCCGQIVTGNNGPIKAAGIGSVGGCENCGGVGLGPPVNKTVSPSAFVVVNLTQTKANLSLQKLVKNSKRKEIQSHRN